MAAQRVDVWAVGEQSVKLLHNGSMIQDGSIGTVYEGWGCIATPAIITPPALLPDYCRMF